MADEIFWPLQHNLIRGRSERNTFGMVRRYGSGAPKPHQGWDFVAPVGMPAWSIANGEIEYVREIGDLGLRVCLRFAYKGRTLYALYAHLEKSFVTKGNVVKGNDLIVVCGKSGNAHNLPKSEEHLHLEIRTKPDAGLGLKNRVSPLEIFQKCPLTIGIPG